MFAASRGINNTRLNDSGISFRVVLYPCRLNTCICLFLWRYYRSVDLIIIIIIIIIICNLIRYLNLYKKYWLQDVWQIGFFFWRCSRYFALYYNNIIYFLMSFSWWSEIRNVVLSTLISSLHILHFRL